jgi:hypothetical protein
MEQIELQDIEDYWPRRLLRVSEWTSYKRREATDRESVLYGRAKNPEYNILSYTWGRFQAKPSENGSSIDVAGISWTIPRIHYDPDQGGFNREAFERVLEVVARGVDFIWLDIACVPQGSDIQNTDLEAEADDEIGRQAGIFARAKDAYIWLHDLSTEELRSGIRALRHRKWDEAKTILGDRWFSSIWTLQEAFLRKDAVFLSKSGEVATCHGEVVTLQTFVDLTDELLHAPGWNLIYDDLRYCGIETLKARNPLVLLGAVPHRYASWEEDKVCGIMQIFGLHLDRTRGLPALRDDLCKSINIKSPVIAQAFVRPTPPPRKFPTWKFRIAEVESVSPSTGTSATISFSAGHPYRDGRVETPFDWTKIVPEAFYDMVEIPCDFRATISFDDEYPRGMGLRGFTIELDDLLLLQHSSPARRRAHRREPDSGDDEEIGVQTDSEYEEELQEVHGRYENSPTCSVYLDKGPADGVNPFEPRIRDPLNQALPDPIREARSLAQRMADRRILIAVMGEFEVQDKEGTLGVILIERRHPPPINEDLRFWNRIGFCTWKSGDETAFRDFEGIML